MQRIAHLTWPILAVTFIATLGGFHPSDAARDRILLVAVILVALVNVPALAQLVSVGLGRRGGRVAAWLAIRLVASAVVFQLVHGISHEHRGHGEVEESLRLPRGFATNV